MNKETIDSLDWAKGDGLLPSVIQHADDGRVLMLGYMNAEALAASLASGRVTFYSRSKQRLWTKGESSGNVLELVAVQADCDHDTLLIQARPAGPTCHLGSDTCFGNAMQPPVGFLARLEQTIRDRARSGDTASYTARLLEAGVQRCAQKVGEEGVEVALAAVAESPEKLASESADLLYHLLVCLQAAGSDLGQVLAELEARHQA